MNIILWAFTLFHLVVGLASLAMAMRLLTPGERALRARIFDGTDLPVVQVELDGRWRIPGDGHPDDRAARAVADAIVNRLEQSASVERGL